MEIRKWHEFAIDEFPPTDTHVLTSDGRRIPVNSNVLASASPVLESAVYAPRKHWKSERIVRILGVPSDAVVAFLQFLYSSRSSLSSKEGKEAIGRYGMHLIALSHKFRVGWLKRGCEDALSERLTPGVAVDVLRLAKLCDASRLYQRCMLLLSKDFASVQKSDAWRFVQKNDPRFELEVLQFVHDTDQRKKWWRRHRVVQETYRQLSEAMECLEHICTDVGPHDGDPQSNDRGRCASFRTCEGLRRLIRHFAACRNRPSPDGTCPHCRRMWQLFRLHSSVCDRSDSCKVPLCKQFKMNTQIEGKGDDGTWSLLAKRVAVAGVMSSLAKRRRSEHLQIRMRICR